MRQSLVRCTACGKSYNALVASGGQIFVWTSDGACWCGSEEFDEVPSLGPSRDRSTSAGSDQ